MDVSRDPRLLVAEEAVRRLESLVSGWRLPWRLNREWAGGLIRDAKRIVYHLRFSYTPPRQLAGFEEVRRLRSLAGELAGLLLSPPQGIDLSLGQRLILAEARWAINILGGLGARLLLSDEPRPEYAVDVVGVEITRIDPLTGGLWVTRTTTGSIVLTIVTNISQIKVREVRAAAILPPRLFHNVISDAMYSSPPLDPSYKGKRIPASMLDKGLQGAVLTLVQRS